MVSNIAHGGTLAFTHSGTTALDYNNNGVIIASNGIGELGGKITSSSGTGEVIIGKQFRQVQHVSLLWRKKKGQITC